MRLNAISCLRFRVIRERHYGRKKPPVGRGESDRGRPSTGVKGGHRETGDAHDLLCDSDGCHVLKGPRFQSRNTHGTGCTFSAALTASLAKGISLIKATEEAHNFVKEAIKNSYRLGAGMNILGF